jgi:hypothetical protein
MSVSVAENAVPNPANSFTTGKFPAVGNFPPVGNERSTARHRRLQLRKVLDALAKRESDSPIIAQQLCASKKRVGTSRRAGKDREQYGDDGGLYPRATSTANQDGNIATNMVQTMSPNTLKITHGRGVNTVTYWKGSNSIADM